MKNSVLAILIIACILESGEGRVDRDGKALNVRTEIPRFPKVGDSVILGCKYDLGSDVLYTVKWYKGNGEFFRYTPKESPSIKIFAFPGLEVDLQQSNATQLALRRVDLSMSGRYSCEVTTDFPDFITGHKTDFLTVIAFPASKPVIGDLKPRYSVGDAIEANCSSYRSKPAANLTWYINSIPVPVSQRPEKWEIERERDNSETSRLSLHLKLYPTHFIHNRIVVKCTATIYDRYTQSSEVTIYEDDRPKIESVVDNSSSQPNTNNDNRLRTSGSSRSGGSHPIRYELIKIGAFFSIRIQSQFLLLSAVFLIS